VARGTISSSGLRQRRRKRRYVIAGLLFALVLVALVGACLVANANFLQITSTEVSGAQHIPQSAIIAAVSHDLNGKYAGLFSHANIFLYPKTRIQHDLLALYPTLSNAEVRAQNFHTISVAVTERTAEATWCGTSPDAQGSCVSLDDTGLAYANAPDQATSTYFGPLPAGPLPKQFLTPASFRSLSALVATFAQKVTPDAVESVTVDENNDVTLSFSPGYKLLFSLNDDSGAVFQHFTLVLTSAPFLSHSLNDFEYIDLRFGDKVYYKLKGQ
jgi:hypothetical protein